MKNPLASPQPSALVVSLAGALVIAAAMGIGRFAYTPLLPGLVETLGWSVAQAGDVASANYLGYLLGAMLAVPVVHRPWRRAGLFAGLLLSALSTAACALITAYPLWLLLRFLSGLASAFAMILGTAVVVETLVRHQRPRLQALHFSGLSFGIIISVLIVEIVERQGFSVFAQWGVLGLLALVMLGTAWRVLGAHDSPSSRPPAPGETGNRPGSRSALRCLIAAYGLFGFGYVVTATFIVAMARDIDGFSYLEPATWIVVGLVGAPSLFLWQTFSEKYNVFLALRLAFAIEAVGVLLAGVASSSIAVLAGGAMLGGTFMAITSMGFVAARQLAEHDQGRAIAWMTVSFGLGQLLGPAVAGRMAEASGSFAAPSALAALLLLCGFVLIRDKH